MSQNFIQRVASENRPLHALLQGGGGLIYTAMAGAQPKTLGLARGLVRPRAKLKTDSLYVSKFHSARC